MTGPTALRVLDLVQQSRGKVCDSTDGEMVTLYELLPFMNQMGINAKMAKEWIVDFTEKNKQKEKMAQNTTTIEKRAKDLDAAKKNRFLRFTEKVNMSAETLLKLLPYVGYSARQIEGFGLSRDEKVFWTQLCTLMKDNGITAKIINKWIDDGRERNEKVEARQDEELCAFWDSYEIRASILTK